MKHLLQTLVLSGGLLLPPNQTTPPVMPMATVPASVHPEPVVIPIIPAAIGIGVGVGIVGWAGIKALNGVLRIWEHRITNNVPEVGFTVPLESEDYPE